MIPFNKPPYTGNEEKYVIEAMRSSKISGDGGFGLRCQAWFEQTLDCKRALLTPSCTHALEMAAILINVEPGDEVIMPSYTFVSTANAFALRGAKIVFIDIRPETMNMDERLIEAAITSKTKAIVPVHYAGVACEMDTIMDIAKKYSLFVIEDAAQAIVSTYKSRPLGTIGHLAAYSFHETKNVTSGGEGGLLIVNDEQFVARAEILREKGTNRNQFFRGMVDKYSWVDIGSSYLPSELQAAYLWGQIESIDELINSRLHIWELYHELLLELKMKKKIDLPTIPNECIHNAHMFYIKVPNLDVRTKLIKHLAADGVMGIFHYVPLHSAPAGMCFSRFNGEDTFTTRESERLIRLPLWYGLGSQQVKLIAGSILRFFS